MISSLVYSSQQEKVLIEGIRQGNTQDIGRLYDIYAPILMGIISRITRDEHLTSHALQSTFVKILQTINGKDFLNENLCCWMLRIARSEALKLTPKDRRPNDQISLKVTDSPLELTLIRGYSIEQAAEKLQISEVSLLQALRKELQQYLRKVQ